MRYEDCDNPNCTDCGACSLCSYGKDCHNNPVNKLAFYRKRAGLTQKQLAEAIGLKPQNISALERGDRELGKVAAETVLIIAKTLGITVDELL